ncbi:type I restriction endonuclease [Paracoccus sp. FO-3]|uniref:type I restriction endonuclease n=1 Tax=Paracoccus sp. FO-3 TaxID=1335059 RepID=UPI0015E3C792|nr:type I restriction endonuclease [Paracoccus sp. FO-3]
MTSNIPKNPTEYDLETAISAAIEVAFPRLGAANIKHQIEFTIRLGHAKITTKGRESWIKRGRADILLTLDDKPLAIVELKKRGTLLTANDGEQGLSYARLLPVMAPFVVVTNGDETRIIETFSGEPYTAGSPDAKIFEGLMVSAAKLAAGDRDNAIATLMGTDPRVWTAAVATASARAINELTATPNHPLRPFGPLKIRRLATCQLAHKLRTSLLVLVSGPPLVGKTNVLEQFVRLIDLQAAGGLFLECGASEVFRKVSDLLADTLDWPVNLETARNWVRQISRAGGPALVLAIDRLDPEDRDDVRMIEDLTSSAFGPALRVVVGLDEDATRRVLRSADGRRESAIGRRATVIEVGDLTEPEYIDALKALAEMDMGIMDGGQHSSDLRRLWLLQAMATRLSGIKREGIGIFPAVPGLEIIAQARANFCDPELRRRYAALGKAITADAQDQTKPYAMALELMGRYFVRRATLEGILPSSDLEWLLKQGYLTPSIAYGNISILTIGLPELLASEIARYLAVELGERVEDDPVDAAEWLAGAASNLLFGDIVAAQAILDLGSDNGRIPLALFDALADMKPTRETMHAGQHLSGWVEGVGPIDIRPQDDGSMILTINGEDHIVESGNDQGESFGNIHAWLILSQLASRRFAAKVDGATHRLDPEALLLVGTADFVLRQPRNDLLMDAVPVHDTDEGGQFVCHNAGVVEAVTQSILKYLSTESREDRNAFVSAAMDIDSIYLTARLDIALRMLTRSTDDVLAAWARKVLVDTVRPAFLRHAEDH